MTDPGAAAFWDERWSGVLRAHADVVARRPPNDHLTAVDLPPGTALDAGCGHGAETLWLAGHGWHVTAVDFSSAAHAHARATAEATGLADWVEADLGVWAPRESHYDLVVCLYVHVAGSVTEMVRRMASGVAPGGTLLLAGHQPAEERPRTEVGGVDAVIRARKPKGASGTRAC
jgi:2-polyprenyl-3-methyl-5-hydroxy-6-metoxy-1,4-benzoquinol methylase